MLLRARYEFENGSLREAFEVEAEVVEDADLDADNIETLLDSMVQRLSVVRGPNEYEGPGLTDEEAEAALRVVAGEEPPMPAEAATDDEDTGSA